MSWITFSHRKLQLGIHYFVVTVWRLAITIAQFIEKRTLWEAAFKVHSHAPDFLLKLSKAILSWLVSHLDTDFKRTNVILLHVAGFFLWKTEDYGPKLLLGTNHMALLFQKEVRWRQSTIHVYTQSNFKSMVYPLALHLTISHTKISMLRQTIRSLVIVMLIFVSWTTIDLLISTERFRIFLACLSRTTFWAICNICHWQVTQIAIMAVVIN